MGPSKPGIGFARDRVYKETGKPKKIPTKTKKPLKAKKYKVPVSRYADPKTGKLQPYTPYQRRIVAQGRANNRRADAINRRAAQIEARRRIILRRERQAYLRRQAARAKQKGLFDRAKKRLGGIITGLGRSVGQVITAPARYVGGYKSLNERAKRAEEQSKQVQDYFNSAQAEYNRRQAALKKKLHAGQISYREAIRRDRENHERLLKKPSEYWTKHFQQEQQAIQAGVSGRGSRLLGSAFDFLGKIGGKAAWNSLMWVNRQGRRGVSTIWGLQEGKSPRRAWNESASGEVVTKERYDKWKSKYEMSPFKGDTPRKIADFVADPFFFLPSGWAAKGFKAAGKTKFGSKVVTGAQAFSKWAKGTKAGWLTDVAKTPTGKFIDKLAKRSSKQFKKFNSDEIRAYEATMAGKAFKGNAAKVNWGKVRDLAARHRAEYDNFLSQERAAGFAVKRRRGYFPTKKNIDAPVFDPKKLEDIPEHYRPFFLKGKTSKNWWQGNTAEQLSTARALRQFANVKARGKITPYGAVDTTPQQIRAGLRRVGEAPRAFTRTWKKSVLKYRPAWYTYNVSHNIPASLMGGGKGTVKSYGRITKAMLKERTLDPKIIRDMPDEVVRGLFGDLGRSQQGWFSKVGRYFRPNPKNFRSTRPFGEKLENLSRAATYDSLMAKGATKAQAIKQVNKYLFDYGSIKNWERLPKTIIPFWTWQKNITLFTAKLPFTNPRAALAYATIRKKLMDEPLEEIPDKNITFTDAETGEQITYNPRKLYEGKMKIGDKWYNVPFLPVMPEALDRMGLNPLLNYVKQLATGKDYFGQSVGGRHPMDLFLDAFPQYTLGKKAAASFGKGKWNKPTERWHTAAGFTKEKQGYDSSKKNFDPKLDPTPGFQNQVRAFLGVPIGKKFDLKEFEANQKQFEFNEKYFAVDWRKKYPDYKERTAAQTKFAKRYGFDLQKDLYDGLWSKYDTPETAKFKQMKKDAFAYSKKIYAEYNKIPKGTGDRSRYILELKKRLASGKTLDKMPSLYAFDKVPRGQLEATVARSDFWRRYWASSKEDRRKLIAANPQYSKHGGNSAAAKFWQKYWASSEEQRRSMIERNPQYAKYGTSERAKFWQRYWASSELERRNLIARHPEYATKFGSTRVPSAEAKFWREYFASSKEKRQEMLDAHPEYRKFKRTKREIEVAWAYKNLNPDDRKEFLEKKGYLTERTEAEWDKWLKERGLHPDQIKTRLKKDPGFSRVYRKQHQFIKTTLPGQRWQGKRLTFKVS